jgi:FAD/FMN-containing dehydrogenase
LAATAQLARAHLVNALIDSLVDAVGPDHVLTDPEVRAGFETDWSGRWSGTAAAVVRPADSTQVKSVLAACDEHGASIVPQGGNTGLVGGSVPRPGGQQVILTTARLTELGEPDPATGQVCAGAGVTLAALQTRAREHGWDAGLDLGARDSATVGGIVACDAGGTRAIRYGTARARVGGIEAVLADGTRVSRMNGLLKDNAGLSLEALLVGSEGILGVITEVLWRLVPSPGELTAALVPLSSVPAAVELTARLRESVRTLEALELMTATAMDLSLAYLGASSPAEKAPLYALIECEADDDSLAALSSVLQDAGTADRASVAVDAAGRERLRRIREAIPEAIASRGLSRKYDIGVPAARLSEFVATLDGLVDTYAPGSLLLYFGHLGDGNLHVSVLGAEPDNELIDNAIFSWVAECEGTISAEHGVGFHKARYLSLVRSSAELQAMWAIKRALDPHLILNPGAVLEVE